ncbi:unnamed protein product [Schistosoma turkestanicum]|nr:unnamed protein product [Schistosoma turkestanicum]
MEHHYSLMNNTTTNTTNTTTTTNISTHFNQYSSIDEENPSDHNINTYMNNTFLLENLSNLLSSSVLQNITHHLLKQNFSKTNSDFTQLLLSNWNLFNDQYKLAILKKTLSTTNININEDLSIILDQCTSRNVDDISSQQQYLLNTTNVQNTTVDNHHWSHLIGTLNSHDYHHYDNGKDVYHGTANTEHIHNNISNNTNNTLLNFESQSNEAIEHRMMRISPVHSNSCSLFPSKPPYSYIALIAMAIKYAPGQKITLNVWRSIQFDYFGQNHFLN